MSTSLHELLTSRRTGPAIGVTSVCSAHPWVVRAAAEQAVETGGLLLIEATSNQVNQFGGYTGMRPRDFRRFATHLVESSGFRAGKLTLGGDHLGPNPWRAKSASEAMHLAEAMVTEYVAAGFTKIHLDASIALGGDPLVLSNELVAERAVRLCEAAEGAVTEGGEAPVYVIGTEVPVPGGAAHTIEGVDVTSPDAAQQTLEVHRKAFFAAGLERAWERVIALVVQPGVEFDHDSVVEYDRSKASQLSEFLRQRGGRMVFEAHSTDYQRTATYRQLVEDGFAILKVGPALTFALREALYRLATIEKCLIPDGLQSRLEEVVEAVMEREPEDWLAYYHGDAAEQRRLRVYSYSDRVRYYWGRPEVAQAVEKLVQNLSSVQLPHTMLSQHMPVQYKAVREGRLRPEPVSLVVDAVREVLRVYDAACQEG